MDTPGGGDKSGGEGRGVVDQRKLVSHQPRSMFGIFQRFLWVAVGNKPLTAGGWGGLEG